MPDSRKPEVKVLQEEKVMSLSNFGKPESEREWLPETKEGRIL